MSLGHCTVGGGEGGLLDDYSNGSLLKFTIARVMSSLPLTEIPSVNGVVCSVAEPLLGIVYAYCRSLYFALTVRHLFFFF